MRSSSTRRLAAALSASTLALVFSLGAPAFGGEQGKGADHRKDRAATTSEPSTTSGDDDSITDTSAESSQPNGDNAHPSGKDRHEDRGAQGHSTSAPDENGSGPERDYEGTDKPFATADGTGGVDDEDQDGNNGCGNDDDFEDDNEGLCLGRQKESTPVKGSGNTKDETCPDGTTMTEGGKAPEDCESHEVTKQGGDDVVVMGSVVETGLGAAVASEVQSAPEQASVLGIQLERTAPAAAAAPAPDGTSVLGVSLARTGLSFTLLAVAIALGLLGVGFALKRAGRVTSGI